MKKEIIDFRNACAKFIQIGKFACF